MDPFSICLDSFTTRALIRERSRLRRGCHLIKSQYALKTTQNALMFPEQRYVMAESISKKGRVTLTKRRCHHGAQRKSMARLLR